MMKYQRRTNPRLEILIFIDQYHRLNHRMPGDRDIARAMDYNSTCPVKHHLDKMRDLKWIDFPDRTARSVWILPEGERMLRENAPAPQPQQRARQPRTAVYTNSSALISTARPHLPITIPIAGLTFGGHLNMVFTPDFTPTAYDAEDTLSINLDTLPRGLKAADLFALRVQGLSMIEAHIHDGDYIIVRKDDHAERGEMIVAFLEDQNETTLKYFYPEKDCIRLEPANAAMQPIIIDGKRMESFRIMGKVVQVVRSNEES